MSVTLNRPGFDHARKLIKAKQFVFDQRDAWSEISRRRRRRIA